MRKILCALMLMAVSSCAFAAPAKSRSDESRDL